MKKEKKKVIQQFLLKRSKQRDIRNVCFHSVLYNEYKQFVTISNSQVATTKTFEIKIGKLKMEMEIDSVQCLQNIIEN